MPRRVIVDFSRADRVGALMPGYAVSITPEQRDKYRLRLLSTALALNGITGGVIISALVNIPGKRNPRAKVGFSVIYEKSAVPIDVVQWLAETVATILGLAPPISQEAQPPCSKWGQSFLRFGKA